MHGHDTRRTARSRCCGVGDHLVRDFTHRVLTIRHPGRTVFGIMAEQHPPATSARDA
jgi:hypothetical protein